MINLKKKATRVLTSNEYGLLKSKRSTSACTRNNIRLDSCKRSQEEMVGFVLIVVLAMIAGVVLLGIALRKPVQPSQSAQVDNFLSAAMLASTNCIIGIEPLSLEDIIKSCYGNENCLNGKSACNALNDSFNNILEQAWPNCEDCKYSGYKLETYYSVNDSGKQNLLEIAKNCTNGYEGEKIIAQDLGQISVNLDVCFRQA